MITFCERAEENGVGAWKKLRRRTAGRCQMASTRNRISGFGFKLLNWKIERRFVGARIIQTQKRRVVLSIPFRCYIEPAREEGALD